MVLSSLLQALRAELSLSLKTSSRRLAEVSARLVPILLSSLLNNRLDGQPLLASISLSGELRVASPHHLLSWYFGLWLQQAPLGFVEQFPQTLPPPRGERYREALPEDNGVVPDETPRPLDVVAHDCFFHFLLCHVDRLLSCSRPGWSRRGGFPSCCRSGSRMLQVERFCPRRVFHPLGLESSLLRLHGDYTTKRLAGKYVVLPISIPFGRALHPFRQLIKYYQSGNLSDRGGLIFCKTWGRCCKDGTLDPLR